MRPILFCILVFSWVNSHAEVIEKVVATVNSELILESDFRDLKDKFKNPTLIDETLIPEPSSGNISKFELLKSSRSLQLEYLLNEKTLDSEVKRLNMTVSLERVDQEIREMAKKNGLSKEELLKAVRSEGIMASDYQAFMKTKLERQSLIEAEIISKLRITDEEASAEFQRRNKAAPTTVFEYSLAHIFFNPKKGGAEAAAQRAQVVLKKLSEGQAFETLAEQYSEDPSFSNGGFLGQFKSGEFMKEIENGVASLNSNDVSALIRSKMGFHVVKVLSKKAVSDPRFDKEKDRIKSQLMEVNFRRQLKIWLQSKKEDAVIRINASKN